ncbi:hypothetical protein OHS33_20915 [Streptomyces sp. NBC_00536]|uniref:imidazolonepropionase-like domain-containing protein n=1 Tax=Streptomyces sp. NBC_00536 TaxID=2975769 RepID=UPI002E816F67|nr:hypothetical protein [Streptomyces sp. NBC_00536]WUC80564.1 hypothetical protein OHS33_20915 [Streptomyces sp. NBC_00536]
MLTLHTADLLVTGPGSVPVPGGAVLVEGDRIAGVGPYEALAERYPHARTRRWPGVLTPGLVVRGAELLLERTYYPDDPYEIAELGADPVTGAEALDALGLTEARWGNSARRATQKLLSRGVVAVGGRLRVPSVRTAVSRSGLALIPAVPVLPGDGRASGAPDAGDSVPPSLDPFAGRDAVAGAFHGALERGGPARFAAFDAPDLDALLARGATTCVATVIGGRLLHRRR